MRAIYKRELKSFFHSFVGCLFIAATLVILTLSGYIARVLYFEELIAALFVQFRR